MDMASRAVRLAQSLLWVGLLRTKSQYANAVLRVRYTPKKVLGHSNANGPKELPGKLCLETHVLAWKDYETRGKEQHHVCILSHH